MLLSAAAFAVHDASAKQLGQNFSVYQITFMRFTLALAMFLPVIAVMGWRTIATTRPWVQGSRAAVTVLAQILAYFALSNMLLADVTAINYTRPLFLTVLAVILLAEKASWRRWAATIVGFGGMLLMVQPGAGGGFIGWAPLAAITSSLLFASLGVVVRRYAESEHPNAWMFYYMVAGIVLSAPGTYLTWQSPTWFELQVALLLAAIAIFAQAFFILAFTVGEASAVGPMDYTRLVWATMFGWFLFSESPALTTWIGVAIIVAASYYVASHEARTKRR
jgi:drug/metabolite transporter (DMT)-like permease